MLARGEVDKIIGIQNRSSSGEVATLKDIVLTRQNSVSADESLIEFWLICTVEIDGQGVHDPALARIPANGKLPTREEIEAKIEEVAAGYQELADLQRAAHADDRTQEPSVSQAELEQAARELRRRVSKVIRAGGTATASLDPGGMKTTDQAPTHGADRDYADVSDLEPSSEEDEAMARGVFESEDNEREDGERATQVIVTVAESQWLIRAYGGLSLEQLGELLTTGGSARPWPNTRRGSSLW